MIRKIRYINVSLKNMNFKKEEPLQGRVFICFAVVLFLIFPVVRPFQLVKDIEQKRENHSDDAGKHHAGQLNIAETYRCAGQSGDKYNGCECQVPVLAVVYLLVYHDPDSGSTDHSVEKE